MPLAGVSAMVVGTVLAMVLAAAFAVLLGVLTAAVVTDGAAPLPVDLATHGWVLSHRSLAVTAVARAVTETGSNVLTYALAALAGGVAVGRRRWWLGSLCALLALLAGQGVRLLLLAWVARPRPPVADWAASAGGPAFPSGHATTSALVAALVCVALSRRLAGRRLRAAQALALVWAGGVGVSRVYLGVHWFTDVLAAWLLVAFLVALSAACRLVASRLVARRAGFGALAPGTAPSVSRPRLRRPGANRPPGR